MPNFSISCCHLLDMYAYVTVTMVTMSFFCYKVTSLTFELSSDPAHENHGMLITVRGKKPSSLTRPEHIALDVRGDSFWKAVSSSYGDFAASMAKYVCTYMYIHNIQCHVYTAVLHVSVCYTCACL